MARQGKDRGTEVKPEFPCIMTFNEMADRFGFDRPDQVMGFDPEEPFFVHGPPQVLLDSNRPSSRLEQERLVWAEELGTPEQPRPPLPIWQKVFDRMTGR